MKYERTHFQRLRIGDRFRFPPGSGGASSASFTKTSKEGAKGPDGDVLVALTDIVLKVCLPRK